MFTLESWFACYLEKLQRLLKQKYEHWLPKSYKMAVLQLLPGFQLFQMFGDLLYKKQINKFRKILLKWTVPMLICQIMPLRAALNAAAIVIFGTKNQFLTHPSVLTAIGSGHDL